MRRVWLPLFLALGYEFPEAYATVAWLCWLPNLLAAELFIRGGKRAGRDALEPTLRRDAVEV